MSNSPDTGLDLDALELHFLPAWAKQSPAVNRYAKFEGGGDGAALRRESRDNRPDRGPRREGPPGERRRPPSERFGPRRHEGGERGQPRREERREPAQPLPEVSVTLVPEEKGVESIARQIKLAGRAYPIFDIAHLILKKPDRYHVTFGVLKKPDGQIAQPLWVCNLDDTLWLSEPEAVSHVLKRHFDTFYKAEKTPTDPPKGTYTFVAQCGLSGNVLGPPNYHDYQNKLRKLHAERFSRMPFEVYKAKVKIVKDEAVVKKWVEEQSWKTEYACLNVTEPKTLGSREEVEKHFREAHLANIIKTADSHTLNGADAQQLAAPALRQLLRRAWDDQIRFPLKIVTVLSQQFASHGLQFFKVNKTVTHVAVARPHHLDMEATPVSEGIKRIVEFINATPKCTRKLLLGALSPSPAAPPAIAPTATGSEPATATAEAAAPPPPGEATQPTTEQTAVNADLHWLIHQGHVLEFANGRIETAKKPILKPFRPPPKLPVAPAQPVAGASAAPDAAEVASPVTERPTPESAPPDGTQSAATTSNESGSPPVFEPAPPGSSEVTEVTEVTTDSAPAEASAENV
jgi:hypothetical protein